MESLTGESVLDVWVTNRYELLLTTTLTYRSNSFGSSSSSEIYFEQYLLALYWVTGTLTTMGQGGGDLMPQNSRERIFAIYVSDSEERSSSRFYIPVIRTYL